MFHPNGKYLDNVFFLFAWVGCSGGGVFIACYSAVEKGLFIIKVSLSNKLAKFH